MVATKRFIIDGTSNKELCAASPQQRLSSTGVTRQDAKHQLGHCAPYRRHSRTAEVACLQKKGQWHLYMTSRPWPDNTAFAENIINTSVCRIGFLRKIPSYGIVEYPWIFIYYFLALAQARIAD